MNKLQAIALSLAIGLSGAAGAQQKKDDHSAHHPATAAKDSELSEGEVRRVDKGTGKITIRHGEIKNLDMPPMTMVFTATNPALLDQVKPGDKIRFQAEKSGNTYNVMRIEPAK